VIALINKLSDLETLLLKVLWKMANKKRGSGEKSKTQVIADLHKAGKIRIDKLVSGGKRDRAVSATIAEEFAKVDSRALTPQEINNAYKRITGRIYAKRAARRAARGNNIDVVQLIGLVNKAGGLSAVSSAVTTLEGLMRACGSYDALVRNLEELAKLEPLKK
jgi:hypothetical protein